MAAKPLSKQAQKLENIRLFAQRQAAAAQRPPSATPQPQGGELRARRPTAPAIPDNVVDLVLAHRYLYYVENMNVIPDATYDVLERQARSVAPVESKIHGVGSSLADDYTEAQIALAYRLMDGTAS